MTHHRDTEPQSRADACGPGCARQEHAASVGARSTADGGPGRVLMIAAAFPPTGGPGVQRTAKFAKYLPQFGWRPIVWTVDRVDEFPRDVTLADDLPREVVVHRSSRGGAMRAMQRSLRTRTGSGVRSRVARALGWRLDRWAERRSFPDAYAPWARSSLRPLCRLVARQRIGAIYSTFSPPSDHLLGLALKRRTRLPWIADFRDLWTDDYRYEEQSPARARADRCLEQEILRAADVVIGVTQAQTEVLASRLPSSRAKFVTITNGFDPSDFSGLSDTTEEDTRDGRFVLAYIGRLDHRRAPQALLDGLARFVEQLGEERRRFVLRIVGHASEATRLRIEAASVACEFAGYVSHVDAIAEMRSANALLVTVPDAAKAETTIPAKPFEYLAAERPILHVGPDRGECASLINDCDAGLAVPFDSRQVGDALTKLYRAWASGKPMVGCPRDRLAPFSRITLTSTLADILDTLTKPANETEQPR